MVVTPKKPTKNGPTQKSKRSPPIRVPPLTLYFRSKLNMAIAMSPRLLSVSRTRCGRTEDSPSAAMDRRSSRRQSGERRRLNRGNSLLDLSRLHRLRTLQPVEAIGAQQDEMDQERENEQEREQRYEGSAW